MNQYTKDYTGLISYEILSKYHFTANMHYETCIKQNEPFEVEYTHTILLHADTIEHAAQIFVDYGLKLNELKIFYHLPHIAYLIENMIKFEGSFIDGESKLHTSVKALVEQLIKVLNLKNSSNDLMIEVSHKKHTKDLDYYLKFSDSQILSESLTSMAHSLLKKIKQDDNLIPFELLDEVKLLDELDLDKLNKLNKKLIDIKDKAFKSEFIYTVCKTLRDYLNAESILHHPTAVLTNDQARVIYEACKIYGIIDISHEMDYEKINYIKAVIRNGLNKGDQTLTFTTT